MDKTTIKFTEEIKLKDPIAIEGLPGIGLVGKLAADHLLHQTKAKKFCELYSPFFPPQVVTEKDGTVRLVNNEFYHFKDKGRDFILVVGDFQGMTPDSQYEITGKILDVLKKIGVKTIYTLGGLGTGKVVKKPRVFGAANDKASIKSLEGHGVICKGREGGGIFGASGLLLGLGQMEGIEAICLMGETVGQVVDAKAARVLLSKLSKILDIKVDMTDLDRSAEKTEKELQKLRKLQEQQTAALESAMLGQKSSEEDIARYIR